MSKSRHPEPGNAIVARKTDGNPEGKGLNGFMLDWNRSRPTDVVAKPRRQVMAELFTSMLILSANFKFRPVVGAANYLYWFDNDWYLSLIAPNEWSSERRAGFVGTCVLQRDMTWTMTPADLLEEDNGVSNAVGRFYDAFAEMLDTERTLEEILPFYAGRRPYYQRLYANALSRSVRAAMTLGDQASISCRQWSRLLPGQQNELLAYMG